MPEKRTRRRIKRSSVVEAEWWQVGLGFGFGLDRVFFELGVFEHIVIVVGEEKERR